MIRVCRWAAGLKPNRWREWWVVVVVRGRHEGGVGPVGKALNAEPSWGTVNTLLGGGHINLTKLGAAPFLCSSTWPRGPA